MKKMLLLIMFVFSISLMAQKRTEHFKFLGIPLNGTYENFDKQLKNKGFEHLIEYAYCGVFDGDSVLLQACVTEKINNVYGVMITVNKFDTRSEAADCVDLLKSRFEYKYDGTFVDQGTFESLTIYNKLKKPFGHIFVSFRKVKDEYNVIVSYFDSANWQKDMEIDNQDL